MIAPQINPIILKFANMQLTYYSLVYVAAFLTVLFVLLRAFRKKELNLSENEIYDLVILLILGTLVGARIFHVLFWNFNYFLSSPMEIIKIWKGGFSFHGGLLGAAISVAVYAKKHKIPFGKLADILVLPIIFFLALGRITNLLNHEIIGTISNHWCISFPEIQGCRHPIQLYAAAGRFVLFAFLIYLKTSVKKLPQGFLFWFSILLLGIGRFFLDFIREDAFYAGLKIGQWFSIIMIIVSIYFLKKH
jgi:phosphatidylglycerol---prolipoprotein diacylglyceryl transferase